MRLVVVAMLALGLVLVLGEVAWPQTTADDFVARAEAKREAGDMNGCITDYDTAIELNPKHSAAYSGRGYARWCNHDVDGALADYNKAIELNPKDPKPCYRRALAKHGKGDLDGALADYNRAIEADPMNASAYFYRGLAKKTKGDGNGALADYDKAIELDPENSNAYYHRALAKHADGDLDGALADFDKALELDPKDSTAYCKRALAKHADGDLDGALADFDKAIELNPKGSASYLDRGNCHFERGDHAAAAADYRSRLSLIADDQHCALWLYLAREKSGEEGSSDLSNFAEEFVTTNEWPAPVFRLYLGSITPEEVLSAALAADSKTENGRCCEAYFYVGQWHVLHGERDKGLEFLKKCLAQDMAGFTPTGTIHRLAARAELERMGETAPQK